MPKYKLRTLLILLAIGPPMLAGAWYGWSDMPEDRERERLRNAWKGKVFVTEICSDRDGGHGAPYNLPARVQARRAGKK